MTAPIANGLLHMASPRQQLGRTVFTTGQVARLFGVAARTASKWFDNGLLRGFRVPNSNDRRVLIGDLMEFARRVGNQQLLRALGTQLILCGLPQQITEAVPPPETGERLILDALFEAGLRLDPNYGQHIIVLDASLGRSLVLEAGAALRRTYPQCRLIAIAGPDDPLKLAWVEAGFTDVLFSPFAPTALMQLLGGAT